MEIDTFCKIHQEMVNTSFLVVKYYLKDFATLYRVRWRYVLEKEG
jgi:hypothetical protein